MPLFQKLMMRTALPRTAGTLAGQLAPRAAKAMSPYVSRLAVRASSTTSPSPSAAAQAAAGAVKKAIIGIERVHCTPTKKDDLHCKLVYQGLDEAVNELSHHLHPAWTNEELRAVQIEHTKPKGWVDTAAHYTVQTLRFVFDIGTGYKYGTRDEKCYINRIIVLETVAGVPGMVGAVIRHLNSLRRMKRDYGWIHTLLEEAENERMHLMCAMLLVQKPSWIIRYAVLLAQMGFTAFYTAAYFTSPRYCHRFVGYIEEEAVKTYTGMIKDMEAGKLPALDIPAHPMMRAYWQMEKDASLLDVIYNIRADESHHREVNHTFAEMKPDDVNPFCAGY